jgi:hypothetical protein
MSHSEKRIGWALAALVLAIGSAAPAARGHEARPATKGSPAPAAEAPPS